MPSGDPAAPLVLVVMGVAGSGKSTVAADLAARLGWDLGEGDQLHPAANVAKMAAGTPLTDADRGPWLQRVAGWIDDHLAAGRPGVITCSALRRSYRDALRRPAVTFIWLDGPRRTLAERLAARHGHFMPVALLESQLATLQPPGEDERALRVSIEQPTAVQVETIVETLGLERTGSDEPEGHRPAW